MFNYEDANKMSKEAMDAMLVSYSSMTKGFQEIASEATEYSKKSYEQSAAAVEKLVGAKSFEKALEIQMDYAKASYEAMVAQATKMSDVYADIAKQAYKPYEIAASKVKS